MRPIHGNRAIARRVLLVSTSLVGLMATAGCDSGPRAPVLRDSPVYQNNREGFRFLVPDNWVQSASAVLPKEELEREVILVQYRMRTANVGATLEVLCFDETEPSELDEYHRKPSHGQNWKSTDSPAEIEINDVAAVRMTYGADVDGRKMGIPEDRPADILIYRSRRETPSFIIGHDADRQCEAADKRGESRPWSLDDSYRRSFSLAI